MHPRPPHVTTAAVALFTLLIAAAQAAPVVDPDFQIIDEDAAASDRFGTALAKGTGFLAIGSPLADTPELSGGKLTIERPVWIGPVDAPGQESAFVESIEHLDAGQNAEFGAALAASGDRLFVGSPGWRLTEHISTTQGAVFVYDVPSSVLATSSMLQMISPGSLERYDEFGDAVACGLDDYGILWLAVGVPGRDNDAGAVWMYLHDSASDTWTLQETVQPAGLQAGDRFGDAVALDGDLLVIGAPGTDSDSGAVYVRRLSAATQTWDDTYSIAASESSATGGFGSSVAVSGYHILIGGPDGTGHASLWTDISTAGLLVHSMDLSPDSWIDVEGWGTAVAIEGDRAVVGGPPDTGSGPDGLAAVFRQTDNDEFQIVARLGEGDWGSDARHGTSVLLSNHVVWVAAPRAHIDGTSGGAVARWDVTRTPGCMGDLDFDFQVDATDLTTLIDGWMAGAGADLTGDDETDILDLLLVLESWGGCPTQ